MIWRRRTLLSAFVLLTPNDCVMRGIEPISLCEVLSHRQEYLNRDIVIHGVVVFMQHGGFVRALRPCERRTDSDVSLEGLTVPAYNAAGGGKGFGVVATVGGRLVMSDRYIPHSRPGPHLAFSVRDVRWEKPVDR